MEGNDLKIDEVGTNKDIGGYNYVEQVIGFVSENVKQVCDLITKNSNGKTTWGSEVQGMALYCFMPARFCTISKLPDL